MITLAVPIVRVVYERGAFDQSASDLVALAASCLWHGMFVYLGRDVLVRCFMPWEMASHRFASV